MVNAWLMHGFVLVHSGGTTAIGLVLWTGLSGVGDRVSLAMRGRGGYTIGVGPRMVGGCFGPSGVRGGGPTGGIGVRPDDVNDGCARSYVNHIPQWGRMDSTGQIEVRMACRGCQAASLNTWRTNNCQL